jgi:acyl-coenzyme A synthetase/AMP-(fatty) acid ligase
MLKLAGHRVSPDEIAAALVGQPGVGLVAVFGAEDRDSVQHAVVVVQGDPADRDLVPRLQARCRQQLPSYMLPARMHVLPELPLNQNGKVDVPALAERFACIDNP